MESDKNVEKPSTKIASRSWKKIASRATNSERMKKTPGSGPDRKEPWHESDRRREGQERRGGDRQEGEIWIEILLHLVSQAFCFRKFYLWSKEAIHQVFWPITWQREGKPSDKRKFHTFAPSKVPLGVAVFFFPFFLSYLRLGYFSPKVNCPRVLKFCRGF